MEEQCDQMEVGGGEEAENEYFRTVTSLTAFTNLDQSIDSVQGSLALPTFALGQSTSLQGSQGFQFLNINQAKHETGESAAASNVVLADLQGVQGVYTQPATVLLPGEGMAGSIGGISNSGENFLVSNVSNRGGNVILPSNNVNAFNLQDSHFNPVSCMDTVRNTPREILPNLSTSMADPNATGTGGGRDRGSSQGDSGEGASSDEKSGKTKGSPRRGKKSRSSSTAGNDPVVEVKQETSQMVCPKLEPPDTCATESNFTPTLEEILTEKKMALMRSPEVMRFLQEQQQKRNMKYQNTDAS